MKVTLLRYTPDPDLLAGQAAALCTNSPNPEKALQHALESGHESVVEHASFTFLIEGVSRALLAQITRHRIASFSVQSQRYVDMGAAPVVVPDSIAANADILQAYEAIMETVRSFYCAAVDADIPKEDARMVLPEATYTKIMLTMNARELRHFFALRMCNKAQWEIRAAANEMYRQAIEVAPVIFKDAGPGCWRGKCPEKKPCGNPPRSFD